MLPLPLLILAASSAAQAPAAPPPASSPTTAAFPARRGGRPFISPMGEPFRPQSREETGLAEWFHQADRNHDGQVTLDEMQADADRFFAVLDINHDGEIDPDEIEHYETVVAPEISSGTHFAMAAADTAEPEGGRGDRGGYGGGHGGGGHGGGGRGGYGGGEGGGGGGEGGGGHHGRGGGGGGFFRGGGNDDHQGAARFGLLDLPEPVTAADTNFNRGVSQEEFRQAAGQRFLALDLDHRGLLTLAGLEKIRPAPPAQPNRKVIPGEPPSDQTSDPGMVPGNY